MSERLSESDERTEAFLLLLAQNERWLSAYVYSLVNISADAEDILQDCKTVMWRQFDTFDPGTNFRAWARKVVMYHVLNYRRTKARHPLTELDESFIQAVAAEIERVADQLDVRAEVLHNCLRKLPGSHRKLIVLRYFEDLDVQAIATVTRRTSWAVYRMLSRIRQTLRDCVSRRLTMQAVP